MDNNKQKSILNWSSKLLQLIENEIPSEFIKNALEIVQTLYYSAIYEENSFRKRAKIWSYAMNLFFGILLSSFILFIRFDIVYYLAFNISIYMEEMMGFLTSVINWLMGVPVGLKLNKPLTEFLGRFFLYHIYLWDSSILIFKEILPYLLNLIAMSGFLGISLFLSLCKDALSLFVIHTYCFYIYALRIYKLEFDSLKSLFRLFRGKKFNPLRLRIDSYSYDINQLFIGTLGFCIAFFLLPTILMFYVVFLSLRILHRLINAILSFVIQILTNIPIYEISLYFISTSFISDKVFYSIEEKQSNNEKKSYIIRSKNVKRYFKEILKETDSRLFQFETDQIKTILPNIVNGVKI